MKTVKLTGAQLAKMDLVLQIEIVEGQQKSRTFGTIAELTMAGDVFRMIRKHLEENTFKDAELKMTAEQMVFISRLIESIQWTVIDADIIVELKALLK